MMAGFNVVMVKCQQENDLIRLAEGREGWGLIREIEALPEIEDLELPTAAKKVEKWIKQRRKLTAATNKQPFCKCGRGSTASRHSGYQHC